MAKPSPGHVATVADTPIPVAWLDERLVELRRGRLGRHLPPDGGGETERLGRWVVQELVTDAVLLHEARQAGLLAEPEVARGPSPSLASGGRPILSPDVRGRLFDLVTRQVAVSEEELLEYYERNPDLYRRPEARLVRYWITQSEAGAGTVLKALSIGAEPEPVPGLRPGLLPSLHRGEFVGPFEDALFEAVVGDVVGPFDLEQGWTVGRVEAIAPESTTTFEAARACIEAELASEARARAFEEWVASRRTALAVIEPAHEHPGHPLHGLPRHRH